MTYFPSSGFTVCKFRRFLFGQLDILFMKTLLTLPRVSYSSATNTKEAPTVSPASALKQSKTMNVALNGNAPSDQPVMFSEFEVFCNQLFKFPF